MDRKKPQISKTALRESFGLLKSQIWEFLEKIALAVFAQTPHELGPIGGKGARGLGPWAWLSEETKIGSAAGVFTDIISRIIGVMTIIAGIWFIFQFIIGAYSYMVAGGDQQKMTNATKKITSALIGLIIIVAAYAIISLLGTLLGFEILKPQILIEELKP